MHISDLENQTVIKQNMAVRNIELCVKMVLVLFFNFVYLMASTLILKVRNVYRTRKLELNQGAIYILDSWITYKLLLLRYRHGIKIDDEDEVFEDKNHVFLASRKIRSLNCEIL